MKNKVKNILVMAVGIGIGVSVGYNMKASEPVYLGNVELSASYKEDSNYTEIVKDMTVIPNGDGTYTITNNGFNTNINLHDDKNGIFDTDLTVNIDENGWKWEIK